LLRSFVCLKSNGCRIGKRKIGNRAVYTEVSQYWQAINPIYPKGTTLLLPTLQQEKAIDMLIVKIADADFLEVTDIQTENDGNKSVVEYSTAYKNKTPFAALSTIDFNRKAFQKERFSLYDGWMEIRKMICWYSCTFLQPKIFSQGKEIAFF
jgi:hypothetical protein